MARAAQARRMEEPESQQQQQVSHVITFDRMEKMNTKNLRQSLQENEVAWMENLQPIAPNNLQVVPAALAAIANISGTTSKMFPANIGAIDYIIVFTTNGAGIAINAANGVVTTFAAAATFTNPDMTVYASQRILIMDTSAAGYSTWDGTLFVKGGGISPNIQVTNGGTYAATPAVTITGGSGAGATAHAVMGGSGATQFVAQVVLDNPGTGYKPGDVITVNFAPASTTVATARIWPQVTGTTIDVFAGRVWWGNGRILNFTGTQGFDDTNVANAAGATTVTDSDLAHVITAIRNRNNYLYIFGDQSVRQIGTITVSSSITLFTPLVLASDIGTSFPQTIASFNRIVLFANKNGVYGILGASIQKLSDDLDGIFQLTDFTQIPSSALNDLHSGSASAGGIHCYLLLLRYNDPVKGVRSLITAFDGQRWFNLSQGNNLKAITSIPLGSTTQVETFGSSGGDITQLLQDPNTSVNYLLITSLTPHGQLIRAKKTVRAGVAITTNAPQSFTMIVDTENGSNSYSLQAASAVTWVNGLGQVVQFQNNVAGNVNWTSGGFRFPFTDVTGYGKFLGVTIIGSGTQISINAIAIEYTEADLWGLSDVFTQQAVTHGFTIGQSAIGGADQIA
jgi:hypothetical protein